MYNRFIIITVCFAIIFSFAFLDIAFADYPDGYYDVQSVIDGDSFKLTDDTIVRLIGIDAPESGEACSEEATQKLASLIAGKTVYLEKDVSETNIYGRLLRYVYVNDIFVNLGLVYDGYAYAVSYPPDVAYDSQLADAEEGAIGNTRGCLWETIHRDNDSYWAVASCFIATAAYGSPVNPYVKILRKFRDKHLLTHKIGRELVRIYYSYSPVIAGYISKHDSLKVITRLSLLPVIGLSWVILKFGPETTIIIIMLLSGGLIGIFLFNRK
jgi:endonuclease YncB( thermonuclease family)